MKVYKCKSKITSTRPMEQFVRKKSIDHEVPEAIYSQQFRTCVERQPLSPLVAVRSKQYPSQVCHFCC